ncbi:DUF6436 domain-containing protein [Alteromonas sp. BMJM2]|uniref:DUF6436 domain-containing protein n=1 Tax=Alteromonas sp. BMJM2 TaxID=2954241 RepID=UPI0022B4D7BE|nr:DUF6436 domain-containing protein [Alteromonas sp. BMJM2]
MTKGLSWALLALWASGLLAAMLVYSQRQLSEFDPDGILLHHSTSPTFDSELLQLLKDSNVPSASIIHVGSSESCYCETLTAPHQTQLLNRLGESQYGVVDIALDTVKGLSNIITTVPALIVIDENYQLRYVGPYATGYGCFTGKNLVDQVVSYTHQLPYNGAIINSDATGCFC